MQQPLSDDFMNMVEVVACLNQDQLVGITFLNPHCFIPGEEGQLKRSFELKIEILTELLGWNLLVVDQQEFMELKSIEDREAYISERLKLDISGAPPERKGGRRVKRGKNVKKSE